MKLGTFVIYYFIILYNSHRVFPRKKWLFSYQCQINVGEEEVQYLPQRCDEVELWNIQYTPVKNKCTHAEYLTKFTKLHSTTDYIKFKGDYDIDDLDLYLPIWLFQSWYGL